MDSLDKYNQDRHILISVHDKDLVRIGFLDNEKAGTIHYFNENWHRYLSQGSETFDFSVYKTGEDVSILSEENYVSFHFEYKDHLFKIVKIEETETELTCYCESTNLELLNEEAQPFEADKAMTLAEYLKKSELIGNFRYSNLTLKINEVANKKLKLSWDSSETKLKRLLSIVTNFEAECEFITELNSNGTLKTMYLNVYHKHDDDFQGVGTRRVGKTLYYGNGIDSIRRTVDITEIATSIEPKGTKEIDVEKDGTTTKETVEVNLTKYKTNDVLDSEGRKLYYLANGVIYAPQSRDRFPSVFGDDSDKWIRYRWNTEYSTESALYGHALSKLKTISEPSVEYEIEGDYDLEIGDTIMVHDSKFDPPLILEVRVSEQEYCFTNPQNCRNTFSNIRALESKLSANIMNRMQTLIEESLPITLDVVIEGTTVMKEGSDSTAVLTGRLTKGNSNTYADSWAWYKDGEKISDDASISISASDISGSSAYRVEAKKGERKYTKIVTMTEIKDGLGIKDLKDQYTVSDSATSNTGNNWSDNVVEYEDGKAIWSRYEITWDDGSKTHTTPIYNAQITTAYIANLKCGELEADNVKIHGSLEANEAHFKKLDTDYLVVNNRLTANEADIDNLQAENATISNLVADKANVSDLTAVNGKINNLEADNANLKNLVADKATIADLNAVNGKILLLEAGKADIGDLTAISVKTDSLEAGVADINLLLSGSTVSGSTQTIVLNAKNATFDSAFFKSLVAENVTASSIIGDTISTNQFTIESDDGGLKMADKTIQIRDKTRVRIQIGEDDSGDYNLYLWDSSGKLLWDAQGLTATGIKRPIIKNSMVANDANISGSKLNINSVVSSINNGTSTILGTRIKIGNQTLDVAFDTLSTKTDENTTVIQSQATSITAIQGELSSLITDVKQINETKADGTTVEKLTNNYNSLKQTVNGTVSDIGSLKTSVSTKADSSTVTTIQNAQNTLSNTVDGLSQRIQSAEKTIKTKADNSTVTTIQNNYNTLSNTVNGLESSVGSVTTTVNGTIASSITLFYSSDSTSVPALPTSKVTSTSTGSKTWTTAVPTYNASYPYLYTCMQQTTVAGNVKWTKAVSGSYSNYVSGVNSKANAGIKETTTLFYASATASTPSKPTSAVTTSNATTYGAWNKTLPTYSKNYPYLYLCTQTQTNGGTYTWTNVESGSYADYISSLSSEQASLKTTVNSITSKVSNLTSAVGANKDGSLSKSLTEQISEVKQTADGINTKVTRLQTQVGGIQVGGRNLIVGSSKQATVTNNTVNGWYKNSNDTTVSQTTIDGVDCFYLSRPSATTLLPTATLSLLGCPRVEPNTTYTYSGWLRFSQDMPNYATSGAPLHYQIKKLTGDNALLFTNADSQANQTYTAKLVEGGGGFVAGKWKRIVIQITIGDLDSSYPYIYFRPFIYGSISAAGTGTPCTEVWFRGVKLEKGTLATDYTEAPQDIDNSITSIKEYATSIDQKADSISLNVSAVEKKVDNLEAGGRNLILNSDTQKISKYANANLTFKSGQTVDEWHASDAYRVTGTKGTNNLFAVLESKRTSSNNPNQKTVKGQDYTHSIYIKNFGDPVQIRNNGISDTVAIVGTNEVTRAVLHGVGNGVNNLQFTFNIGNGTNIDFIYWHPKIEAGNVVTDWTPAPEDVDKSISSVKEYASSIEQKADSISSSVSSVQTQMNNLEVGGRNLVEDSKSLTALMNNPKYSLDSSGEYGVRYIKTTSNAFFELWVPMYGEYNSLVSDVTISCEAKTTDEIRTYINIASFKRSSKGRIAEVANHGLSSSDVKRSKLDDGWTRYVWTIPAETVAKINNQTNADMYGWQFKVRQVDGVPITAYVRKPKVEIGNFGTDWTPAPEDTDADIKGVATRVSTAEQKITPDAITLAVNETVSNGTRSLTNGSSFTLTKDACTIDGAKLIIRGSGKSLEDELDIEVGGRNLLMKSKDERTATFPESSGYQDLSWGVSSATYKIAETISAKAGDTYTLSFDAKADNNGSIILTYFYNPSVSKTGVTSQGRTYTTPDGKVAFTLSTEYKRYSVVWTFNEDGTANNLIPCRALYSNGSGKVYLKNVKLEKGNKPTDWTPAPEDIESAIGTAESKADKAQKSANDAQSSASTALSQAMQSLEQINSLDPIVQQTVEDATKALANLGSWTANGSQSMIDGGKIYTGTITADKIIGKDLASIRATLGDVTTGSISSPDGNIKIDLNGDTAKQGISITNTNLSTTLHIDADGTRVTNSNGLTIAKFTSSGTETADLSASGTAMISGLKIEKQSSGDIWISYGG